MLQVATGEVLEISLGQAGLLSLPSSTAEAQAASQPWQPLPAQAGWTGLRLRLWDLSASCWLSRCAALCLQLCELAQRSVSFRRAGWHQTQCSCDHWTDA